ncbi:MAG: lamin tail domain-containing protein, partial [Prolixibacteraceae bacterium]|nr:lamin tail domain-containing protein [Prolixibacteraceae bacterium]
MPEKIIFLVFFLFAILFSKISLSQADLEINITQTAPIIDGNVDEVWSKVASSSLNNLVIGNEVSESDFSAKFKALWDADNFYLLVEVKDDSYSNDSENSLWEDDAVEVYFDINNDKLQINGDDDYQYVFRWNDEVATTSRGSLENVEFKIKNTSTGYTLEVKFPWITLAQNNPSKGVEIGFDVQIHDDDDGGSRENKICWYGNSDESWRNPSLFATIKLIESYIDLSINSVTTAPIIDGIVDASWNSINAISIENSLLGGSTTTSDFSAFFKSAWDTENLYVLVEVNDDTKVNDSSNDYQDDAIEIYIDINNDKLSSYDATDYQYTIAWGNQTINNNGPIDNFQFTIADTETGYILEIKMPWATLGLNNPKSGELLGFDVHIQDDDDGAERDNKLSWFTTIDQSWQNPSLFATAELVGEGGNGSGNDNVLFPADKPKISVDRGYYNNPFEVTISTTLQGMQIYYTLDGSDPTSSETVQIGISPLSITIDPESTENRGKTPGVVLRTSAKKEGYYYSPIATRTYLFVNKVKDQIEYPGHDWPEGENVNGQEIDLLIDPDVVNDPRYTNLIDDALLEIPTFSIVTNNENLFDTEKGIYVNASEARGQEWERPVSVELIYPNGEKGFQIDAGLRIRGGYSRNDWFRKHAFRLFFRNEYGEGKLNYPLFGDEGVSSFDKIDLRCSQNYSWSKGEDSESPYCTFNRDVFSRDAQREMGNDYTRSRYYHLYLNGLYWGLFQTQERSESSFAASYMGDDNTDYDVIKHLGGASGIEANDGTEDAWRAVWDLTQNGFENNNNYNTIQGLDANGNRDLALPILVDIDNLIDYMNVIFYTGNFDAPYSSFSHDPNNFYAIYKRDGSEGFQFFAHDNEHTLLVDPNGGWGGGLYEDRVNFGEDDGQRSMSVYSFYNFQPQWLHYKLTKNEEYRSRFADRAYELYYNKGIFTPEKAAELFINRTYEYDTALVAESARWGDVQWGVTYTKDDNWTPMIDRTMSEFFPYRTDVVIDQLQYAGLLSSIPAPSFKINNKILTNDIVEITVGTSLSIENTNSSGSIQFTVDGSDPRMEGGGINPSAINGGNASSQGIWQTTIVKARIYHNNEWSALHTIKLVVDQIIDGLQITEIHYNPLGQDGLSGSEFEFIELKNVGDEDINLTACRFNGLQYTFNSETIVSPDQFLVLASNANSFELRYGLSAFDEYEGQLNNGGERISLLNVMQDTILTVKYNDKNPWPTVADGVGFSIVPATSNIDADWSEGNNWRSSAEIGGSPGEDDDSAIVVAEILVNEVLNNSEEPLVDAIELYNPNSTSVNIGYWYLSDDRNEATKWQIPAGTSIPANAYLTFYEGHYNGSNLEYSSNEFGSAFSINSHGEEVFLFSGNSNGNLTAYEHGFDFGDADPDVAFGRHIISTGNDHFVAMASNTFGSQNSLPKVGPVVINQIMYHPADYNFEYIQLVNITNNEVQLFEESSLIPWKVSGIGFDFPNEFSLPAGGEVYLVESAINPNDFRLANNLNELVSVFNYSGSLSNNGEEILLEKSAPQYDDKGETKSPFIHVDKVVYNDNSQWPDADGNGYMLQRKSLTAYGNDPANWEARIAGVSINGSDLIVAIENVPYSSILIASGGIMPYSWSITSGSLPAGLSLNPTTGIICGTPETEGTFIFEIEVSDAIQSTDNYEYSLIVNENTLPIAVNDAATTSMNYNVTVDVLANDIDSDGDQFNWDISVSSAPEHGVAIVNNDQTITFIPETEFFGSDVLSYRIDDVNGWVEAQLTIKVEGSVSIMGELDIQVAQSNDDAEENTGSGQVWDASSDLELTYDVQPGGDQLVGIRFQNITIPQGAEISKAHIQFTTDEVSTNETTLLIQAEAEDNTLPFESSYSISSRNRTSTQVEWTPEAWNTEWESGDKQKTPDLSEPIQEVINRSGWSNGNSMSFIITGTGTRIAESFDGEQDKAAILHLEYITNSAKAVIPIALAGADNAAVLNSLFVLDGSESYSSDFRELNFEWTIVSKPD